MVYLLQEDISNLEINLRMQGSLYGKLHLPHFVLMLQKDSNTTNMTVY